jgi:hypothetical protein
VTCTADSVLIAKAEDTRLLVKMLDEFLVVV